jgi:hypothetical protein
VEVKVADPFSFVFVEGVEVLVRLLVVEPDSEEDYCIVEEQEQEEGKDNGQEENDYVQ